MLREAISPRLGGVTPRARPRRRSGGPTSTTPHLLDAREKLEHLLAPPVRHEPDRWLRPLGHELDVRAPPVLGGRLDEILGEVVEGHLLGRDGYVPFLSLSIHHLLASALPPLGHAALVDLLNHVT